MGAQALYYKHNIILHDYGIYSERSWVIKTVGSLLDLTLGLWNIRCDLLHGADEREIKKKLFIRLQRCHEEVDSVSEQFHHLFGDTVEDMETKSGQYLGKWLETVELAGDKKEASSSESE